MGRCGSGNQRGAGSVSAVGTCLHDAGERGLSPKKGEQATARTEGEKGIDSVSLQTEINLKNVVTRELFSRRA